MVWAVTPLGQHSPGSRDLTPCPHPEEQDDHGPHIRIWQYLDAVHCGIQYDRKIRTVRNKTNVSSFLDLGLMMDRDRPASELPPRPHQLYTTPETSPTVRRTPETSPAVRRIYGLFTRDKM